MPESYSLDNFQDGCTFSNQSAIRNRNLYPIQEQISLRQLWNYFPEFADGSGLWRLNRDVKRSDFEDAFLRMFVDRYAHRNIKNALAEKRSTLVGRTRGCYQVLRNVFNDWEAFLEIPNRKAEASEKMYSDFRIVDDCNALFNDEHFRHLTSFRIKETIYLSKKMNALLPDLCFSYDSESRKKLKIFFGVSDNATYLELLEKTSAWMRSGLLEMSSESNILDLRRIDRPGEIPELSIDRSKISLCPEAIESLPHWNQYVERERPLSRIVDKQFYSLDLTRNARTHDAEEGSDSEKHGASPIRHSEQTIWPLSGKGKEILRHINGSKQQLSWGNTRLEIKESDINRVLEFLADERPLGASQTSPTPGGLGEFIVNEGISDSSRWASAIAALLVADELATSRGTRRIYLKARDE